MESSTRTISSLVPGFDIRIAIRKFCIGWNHAEFPLTFKDFLSVSVPGRVEFAFVLIAPIPVYLVRGMSSARCVIEKEGLVRRGLLLAIDVEDYLISNLIAQVAAIGTDVSLIFHQVRLILVGLRAKESEEVVEALSGWPTIEWACIGRIFIGSYTVLTNCECVVAIVAENFSNGSVRGWNPAIPAGKSGGHNRV